MKSHLIVTLILFLIMVFFPLITLVSDNDESDGTANEISSTDKAKETPKAETVSLLITETGKTKEMTTEEYIFGAVCAEMPASFHTQALKAQAIACYTYMCWLKENADNTGFKADITDNPAHHQGFISQEQLKEKWGSNYDIYCEKISTAISQVAGTYLSYNQKPAMTVFHALSPGRTVSALEIWGTDVPYLQSVTAPGDKLSPDITSTKVISEKDFLKAMNITKEEQVNKLLSSAEKTTEGFISKITYEDKVYNSTDLRSALSLESPFFIAEIKDTIALTVYGKGHGVGMSQYSADYMARQGSTYEEILSHFYPGTEISIKK